MVADISRQGMRCGRVKRYSASRTRNPIRATKPSVWLANFASWRPRKTIGASQSGRQRAASTGRTAATRLRIGSCSGLSNASARRRSPQARQISSAPVLSSAPMWRRSHVRRGSAATDFSVFQTRATEERSEASVQSPASAMTRSPLARVCNCTDAGVIGVLCAVTRKLALHQIVTGSSLRGAPAPGAPLESPWTYLPRRVSTRSENTNRDRSRSSFS